MKRTKLLIAGLVVGCLVIAGAAMAISRKKSKKTRMTTKTEQTVALAPGDALVEFKTTEGDITVRLFGDTPKHRDNFLKLVREGYYDGVLFHRVIKDFMIQTGDPDSKGAPAGKHLGMGGPGYTIDAEIVYPRHFHKRGALAAARQGDQVNPERKSSGSQFYIVTGKTFNDSTLRMLEKQLKMQQMQQIFDSLSRDNRDLILELRRNRDQAGLSALQDSLIKQTEEIAAKNPAALTPEQRTAYLESGGAPHLDGQYTVFGEVVKGMDVVNRIEAAQTDGADRPVNDLKIISAKVVKSPR